MTVEAKIIIKASGDQAVDAFRKVEAAGKSAAAALNGDGKPAFANVSTGAAEASTRAAKLKKDVDAVNTSTREGIAAAKLEAQAARDAAKAQKQAADEAASAIRQARNQARQLGPQVTDIVVGLSTGQSPFTVLLQQGGQLKDVFGGVGNAAKALGSIFTVTRVLVGGLAAVVGALGFAFVSGRQESDALNKSLALTGNVAGTSAGALDQQAKTIAATQGKAIGAVRETLAALVATGEFTATSLGAAGRASLALSKLTGQTAAEASAQFTGLSANVVGGAVKLNQAYNFLSVEQFKYIQALSSQGRAQEAMKVTLEALAATIESRAAPAVGTLEKLWNGVKRAVSDAADAVKGFGRETGVEGKLEGIRSKLEAIETARNKLAGKQDKTSLLQLQQLDGQKDALRQEESFAGESLRIKKRSDDQAARSAADAQKGIFEESKGFQDSLSGISAAGASKRLAEQNAALDIAQAQLNRSNAAGLLSQGDFVKKSDAIDQQRLANQRATIKRQIEIEQGKKTEGPLDVNNKAAAVKGLEGQLADVQGKIAAAAIKGRSNVEAAALTRAQESATAWATIWQKSYDQVRTLAAQNGATQAALIADPVGRATAEATLKTADLRRQVAELQRDLDLRLSLTVDPAQKALLQQQIDELATQGKAALDEAVRGGTFSALQAQYAELTQALSLQEQAIAAASEQSKLTTLEAESAKFAARAKSLPQLEAILQAQRALATTPAEANTITAAAQDVDKLKESTTEFQRVAKGSAVSSFTTFLGDITSSAKTGKRALLDMVGSFAKSLLDLASRDLGQQLFKSVFGAFQGGGGGGAGGGDFLGTAVKLIGSFFHSGGVVGAPGTATAAMSPATWAFAPRYHGGGIAGLRSNEVPSILLKGEEVLTEDDPRHVKNLRGSSGGYSIGALNINTSVSGAQGSEGELGESGNRLATAMTTAAQSVIDRWVARESRSGGTLASRAR